MPNHVKHYTNALPPPEVVYKQRTPNRKRRYPISKKQRKFLIEALTSQRIFADVMEDEGVSHLQLATWLGQKNFCWHLRRVSRALEKQCEMDIAIGGTRGAELLHRTVQLEQKGFKTEGDRLIQCRAAIGLVRLARMASARREALKQKAQSEPQLAHPDHSQEEILRLLDVVEGKEGAD
jgi:hypothetical protein